MDSTMEEVIKNIIHIDKSAAELKEGLDRQISERKRKVNEDIERLKKEIVDGEILKVQEKEKKELEEVRKAAEKIKENAIKMCSAMEESFINKKEGLLKELFNDIFVSQSN